MSLSEEPYLLMTSVIGNLERDLYFSGEPNDVRKTRFSKPKFFPPSNESKTVAKLILKTLCPNLESQTQEPRNSVQSPSVQQAALKKKLRPFNKWSLIWTNKLKKKLELVLQEIEHLKLGKNFNSLVEEIEKMFPTKNKSLVLAIKEIKKILGNKKLSDNSTKSDNTVDPWIEFTQRIASSNVRDLETEAALTTGIGCFSCVITYSLSMGINLIDNNKLLENAFNFSTLYMVFDHLLDNDRINEGTVKHISNIVYAKRTHSNVLPKKRLISDKSSFSSYPKLGTVTYLEKQFFKVVSGSPNSWKNLLEAYQSEIESSKYEKYVNGDMNMPDILSLTSYSCWKGGSTLKTMSSLSSDSLIPGSSPKKIEEKYIFMLGSYVQIVDDLIDIDEDIKKNILTLPSFIALGITRNKKHKRYLENLVIGLGRLISELPGVYNLFKIILINMLSYAVSKYRDRYFSKEFVELMAPYIFNHKSGVIKKSFYKSLAKSLIKEKRKLL